MKLFKTALCVLVYIVFCFSLSSCQSNLSGKYGPDLTSYQAADLTAGTFCFEKNGNVTYTPANGACTFNGKYEILKDSISFDFEEEGCPFEGTFSFEKGRNTVTIDGYTYATAFHNLKPISN